METDFYPALRAHERPHKPATCRRPLRRTTPSLAVLALALAALFSLSGCALIGSRNEWNPPPLFSPNDSFAPPVACLTAAEAQYCAGRAAEAACNPACVDYYYAAASQAWPYHAGAAAAVGYRATELYRSSVQLFIASAARFGRLDRTNGVLLSSGQVVPVTYHQFAWQPDDFSTFLPVGSYRSHRLSNRYVMPGVGVPYVVLSSTPARYPFINYAEPFAATAVLAPTDACGGNFALQFYDPLRTCMTDAGVPVARDLTAPIAYAASHETDAWLENFLRPDRDDTRDGLHMREPFQPGKIPIVFVHGLASDPLTWAQLENDLRAQPAIFSRYQFWFFRYDTGDPFLSSARRLREGLAAIRQTYDPLRTDPNLSQMVLIGHSMGGLVSKMQVTYSGDMLWQSAATRPLSTICTDPTTRANLTAAFYFNPSPNITRVVYIATPHRGSIEAQRCVGRVSSALVEERPDWVVRHAQLVRDNPGAFRAELSRGIPTSIDLLDPDSCILQATERLPYRYGVALHSIIGDDRWSFGQGPTDGVIAVSSARIGGVQSELFVRAEHTRVQRNANTVREVMCILDRHANY